MIECRFGVVLCSIASSSTNELLEGMDVHENDEMKQEEKRNDVGKVNGSKCATTIEQNIVNKVGRAYTNVC